jgi:hypothetical protein
MYAALLLNGFVPDTMLVHPMAWLMWVKDPVIREFAIQAGGGSFFAQFTGNPAVQGNPFYNFGGLGTGHGQTCQYTGGNLTGGEVADPAAGAYQRMTSAPMIPNYLGLPFPDKTRSLPIRCNKTPHARRARPKRFDSRYKISRMKHALLLLCFCTLALAKDSPREWKTGMLVDVTMEKNSKLAGTMAGANGNFSGVIAQRRDDSTYYHIDAGDLTYIAKRTLTHRRDKQVKVTVNAPVKYAISGDDLYLLDEDGKEHKLSVEEKIAKKKTP